VSLLCSAVFIVESPYARFCGYLMTPQMVLHGIPDEGPSKLM
jgi:hypothetical protein